MEYKYKFSVVIPVYKVEEYLEETIESVINQTIGFKDNIQMILVNDGSPDNSEAICLKYKELYPNNVIYVKQKNAGVSAARNKGFTYAEGKYTNFLDSDDKWELDVFEKVYKMYENNVNVDVIGVRQQWFEASKGFPSLDYKFDSDKIVNIFKHYDHIQLSVTSCFFRSEAILNNYFDSEIKYSEDSKFIFDVIIKKENLGIVASSKHMYRKRNTNNSAIQKKNFDLSWYFVTTQKSYKYQIDKSIEKYGYVIPYVQYFIGYEYQFRLKEWQPHFLSSENTKKYKDVSMTLLSHITDNIIMELKHIDDEYKAYILSLKHNQNVNSMLKATKLFLTYKNLNLYSFSNNNFIRIDNVNNIDGKFNIEGRINCPIDEKDFEIYAMVNGVKRQLEVYDTELNNKYTFDGLLLKTKGFKLILSNKTNKLKFMICFKEKFIHRLNINTSNLSGLKNDKYFYKLINDHVFHIRNNILNIKKGNKEIFKAEIKFLWLLFRKKKIKNIIIRLTYFIFRPFKKKKIWIIKDRYNCAKDNGEAIFKYLSSNKNKNLDIYFVIDKNSSDYERLKKYGKVVDVKSFKYKMLFLLSDMNISSHANDWVYNPFGKNNVYLNGLINNKFVFIQHGIIVHDLSKWLHRLNKNISLFITSTKQEYNLILKGKYKYDASEIALTGMPRFDYLNSDDNSRIITIMPTWRTDLAGKIDRKSGKREYNYNFKESNFYIIYSKLLKNKKLNKILTLNKYKLNFVLHPEFLSQGIDFIDFNSDIINVNSEDVDYNKIFFESKLLITDYSSIFFDFAYLKKPEIFFQFDIDTFYQNQIYDKGEFDYERDAFGDVLTTVDEVVDKIEYYIKNDFKMEEKYIERVDNTFAYTDRNNCKRVYEEILKLDNNYGKIDKVIK
jgi:CDP-glycerol glycerophosphotransferase (TagB/SpsB family)